MKPSCQTHPGGLEVFGTRVTLARDGFADLEDFGQAVVSLRAQHPEALIYFVCPDPEPYAKPRNVARRPGKHDTYLLALEEPLHPTARKEMRDFGFCVSDRMPDYGEKFFDAIERL